MWVLLSAGLCGVLRPSVVGISVHVRSLMELLHLVSSFHYGLWVASELFVVS
jgi:hypothetical protein